MRGVTSRRPSAAIVIAGLAIAVAASGSATAAVRGHASPGNKVIKKHSLSGNRIKNNSITGKQINESQVGIVDDARNAQAIDGSSVVEFQRLVATNTTTTADAKTIGDLTFDLDCDANGEPTVTVTTAVPALLRGSKVSSSSGADVVGGSNLDTQDDAIVFIPADQRGTVTLHWATPGGAYADVNAVVDDNNTVGNFDGCFLEGTIIAGQNQ